MEKKFVKKDYYNYLLNLIADPAAVAPEGMTEDMVTEFLTKELAKLVNHKSKPAKESAAATADSEVILEILSGADTGMRVSEILTECMGRLEGAVSSQRVTALLKKMELDGKVERIVEKKIAYYKAVFEESTED